MCLEEITSFGKDDNNDNTDTNDNNNANTNTTNNDVKKTLVAKDVTTIDHANKLTEIQIGYDAAYKKFLSNKIILAWIMKSYFKEFKDYDVKTLERDCFDGDIVFRKEPVFDEDVTPKIISAETEDVSVNDGVVRYDIKFNAISPEGNIGVIVNVESQINSTPGYPLVKRAMYYVARMISAQRNVIFSDSEYEKIRKVYSVWIMPKPEEHEKGSVVIYSVNREDLFQYSNEQESNYDLFCIIMIYVTDPDSLVEDDALKLLSIVASNKYSINEKLDLLTYDFDIVTTIKIEGDLTTMSGWDNEYVKQQVSNAVAKKNEEIAEKDKQLAEKDEEIAKLRQALKQKSQ